MRRVISCGLAVVTFVFLSTLAEGSGPSRRLNEEAGGLSPAAQSQTGKPPDGSQGAAVSPFAREILAAHNAVRAEVKVPPLVWSDQLAAVAQKWADRLLARHEFSHNMNVAYGENLFEITGAAATAAFVVKSWASESRNYNYAANSCKGVCGHYTQLVWRDTKQVGCAVARGGGREVWVCDYDPPGNWVGQRPY